MSTDTPSLLQHDMAVILQLACDADEADPRELLHEIAMIASKHPWPQYDQSENTRTAAAQVDHKAAASGTVAGAPHRNGDAAGNAAPASAAPFYCQAGDCAEQCVNCADECPAELGQEAPAAHDDKSRRLTRTDRNLGGSDRP